MHKVLKKGISLSSKNPIALNKYGIKCSINTQFHKSLSGATRSLQSQTISYYFSSIPKFNGQGQPNYNNNSSNQVQRQDQNVWEKESQQRSQAPQSSTKQNGKFFYSHTKMSNHYILREEEIFDLLNKFNIQYKLAQSDQQIKIEFCPFCLKPHNNEISNSYTLGIKKSTGQFNCFRCGIKGSWWDFKNLLYKNVSLSDFRNYNETVHAQEERMDDSEYYLYHQQLFDKESYKQEIEYLCGKQDQTQRHINFETLVKYKVGIGKEDFINRDGDYIKVPVVYFPMFKYEKSQADSSDEDKARDVFKEEEDEELQNKKQQQRIIISNNHYKLVKCKIRGIGAENKKYMRMKPSGSRSGIFGLNTVPINAKEVVITEGEYDAMAVYQATGLPAISLPNGASNLPLEAIGCLDRFEKIYLWLDNDEVGLNNRQKLAEKLGLNRTYIVNTYGEKDANDILRQDPSRIIKYISESNTIPDQNILMFSDLKEQVYHRLLKFENNQGIRSRRFEFYNDTIKGLRKGELTVLTGPTGSGKTTFLSQLSLDFCQQQVPTLWGSFEIKNEILATNMILQMSGQDLFKNHQKFPYWADRFDMIPMYFMNFFGSTNLDQILSTIEYSIYKYDIQHVVVDNLQFLLGTQARGFEKFDLQDKTIEAFRQLATKKDIHLTLVIHPKKVEENEDLNISSVFGSAKATQEADNVIILQNRDKYRVIDIKKNRFNGDIGKKAIIFDKSNKNFYEMSLGEVSEILSSKKTSSDLVKTKREKILEKIEEEDFTTPAMEIKRNKSGQPNSGNDGDDNGGNNNNGGNTNPPSSSPPPSTQPPSGSSPNTNNNNNTFSASIPSSKKQTQESSQQKIQENQNEDNENNFIEINQQIKEPILNVKLKEPEPEQKNKNTQQEEENLEVLEIKHKNQVAAEQIEADLQSANYSVEDDYYEAIKEELIKTELQGQSTHAHSYEKSSKTKKFIEEEYDVDSLEPMNFDLYKQDKEVKATTSFFKNFSPVPPEEREELLSGSFKKTTFTKYPANNKNYTKYQNNQEIPEDVFEQVFNEKYQINSDIENQILSNKYKKSNNNNNNNNNDDITQQIIEKRFAEKNNKKNQI